MVASSQIKISRRVKFNFSHTDISLNKKMTNKRKHRRTEEEKERNGKNSTAIKTGIMKKDRRQIEERKKKERRKIEKDRRKIEEDKK